jgi:uncharacterized membrane protein
MPWQIHGSAAVNTCTSNDRRLLITRSATPVKTFFKTKQQQSMNNKTLAIISYVTIIGWIIAYVKSKDQSPKSSLVVYHLKQGLGIFIVSIILSILGTVLASITHIGLISTVASVLTLVLWIMGILNAAAQKQKPVPVVGKAFEGRFAFLN